MAEGLKSAKDSNLKRFKVYLCIVSKKKKEREKRKIPKKHEISKYAYMDIPLDDDIYAVQTTNWVPCRRRKPSDSKKCGTHTDEINGAQTNNKTIADNQPLIDNIALLLERTDVLIEQNNSLIAKITDFSNFQTSDSQNTEKGGSQTDGLTGVNPNVKTSADTPNNSVIEETSNFSKSTPSDSQNTEKGGSQTDDLTGVKPNDKTTADTPNNSVIEETSNLIKSTPSDPLNGEKVGSQTDGLTGVKPNDKTAADTPNNPGIEKTLDFNISTPSDIGHIHEHKIDNINPDPIPTDIKQETQKLQAGHSSVQPTRSSIINPSKIWETLKKSGSPRIIISMIGAYNKRIPSYRPDQQLQFFEEALTHVARYAERCGFLYKERDAYIGKTIIGKSCTCPVDSLSEYTYGFYSTQTTREKERHVELEKISEKEKIVTLEKTREKEQHVESEKISEKEKIVTLEKTREKEQHVESEKTTEKEQHVELEKLSEIENYINSNAYRKLNNAADEETSANKKSSIRIPVVLFVINGGLFTLKHVVRAIRNDISVVIFEGTGGAADLIASSFKDMVAVKRKLPVLFERRFSNVMYEEIIKHLKIIVERDWMITIYNMENKNQTNLWEQLTDGIMRAWSFEKDKDDSEVNFGMLEETKSISEYVSGKSNLLKKELFAGFELLEQTTEETEHALVNAFLGNRTDVFQQIIKSNKVLKLSNEQFTFACQEVVKTATISKGGKMTSIQVIQFLCPEDISSLKSETKEGQVKDTESTINSISTNLLGQFCSKLGIQKCCNKVEPEEKLYTDEYLRLAILNNEERNAAGLWSGSKNPMLTSLVAHKYLTAMAATAENLFEEELSASLLSHSELFLSRSVTLLEKMFSHDDQKMAINALETDSSLWGLTENPLHFAQKFKIETFISHSKNQKDANRRLFLGKADTNNLRTYPCNFSGWFSSIKHNWKNSTTSIFTAPVTKILVHIIFFLTSLTMFSFFLIRNLEADSISLQEGLVFIYMLGELLEEILSMNRQRNGCNWSPNRILLHLSDIWNVLDFLCLNLYLLGFCMHLFDSNLLIHTRRIYSISLCLMFIRLLNLLLLSKRFGIIIIMTIEMLVDLMEYLVILIILIIAVGVAYHANIYPNHSVADSSEVEYWRIWQILKIPYWQVYGELYLDTLEASDESSCTNNATIWKNDPSATRCPTADWLTPLIAAFYMMLTNWLLMNVVTGMFSARFERIKEISRQKWLYNRHIVITDYEYRIPSPLNFLFRCLFCQTARCECACTQCCDDSTKDTETMLKFQRQFAQEILDGK